MITRTKYSYSRKINNNSNSKNVLVFFWIFFLGAIANIGYSIFDFIIDPQPIIAFFCIYFGVVYLFIAVVCYDYYLSKK